MIFCRHKYISKDEKIFCEKCGKHQHRWIPTNKIEILDPYVSSTVPIGFEEIHRCMYCGKTKKIKY